MNAYVKCNPNTCEYERCDGYHLTVEGHISMQRNTALEALVFSDVKVPVRVGDRVRSTETGRIGTVRGISNGCLTVQYSELPDDWNSTGAQWFRKV